jgi:cytochrome b561
MMWGKHKESGIWIGLVSKWRLLWRGHDSLYIAAGRLRLRIMKNS